MNIELDNALESKIVVASLLDSYEMLKSQRLYGCYDPMKSDDNLLKSIKDVLFYYMTPEQTEEFKIK